MRKLFKKIHLYLALPAGLLISLICLTGAVLVYEKEMVKLFHPEYYEVQPPSQATLLKPSILVEKVKSQLPDSLEIASLRYSGKADGTAIMTFANVKGRSVSINPYTGAIQGWIKSDNFFSTVRKLHRWLLNTPEERGKMSTGKMIVGLATSFFVFIILTGVVIWIPRSMKGLRNRLTVATGRGWKRFWYDTHVSLGFYASFLLLLMALTGLTWSFGWFHDGVYALFGAKKEMGGPMKNSDKGKGQQSRPSHHRQAEEVEADFDFTTWDRALASITPVYPSFESLELRKDRAQVAINKPGYMRKTDEVELAPDGSIWKINRYADAAASRKVHGLMYSLHTGVWAGYWSKFLHFMAALIGACLPLTGYYLWLSRRMRKSR